MVNLIEYIKLGDIALRTEIHYDPDPRTTVVEEDRELVESAFGEHLDILYYCTYMQHFVVCNVCMYVYGRIFICGADGFRCESGRIVALGAQVCIYECMKVYAFCYHICMYVCMYVCCCRIVLDDKFINNRVQVDDSFSIANIAAKITVPTFCCCLYVRYTYF